MPIAEVDVKQVGQRAAAASEPFRKLLEQIHRVIIGQEQLLHRMLVALLSRGHVLIEGVPGLAKTMAVASLAKGINTRFQRLQFTPDLLPADLIGTLIYRQSDGAFVVQKGPIFANMILADEINRAPAKVQSALLEAMQERQVTIGKETFRLDEPFQVLATQNPIEQEGTYPLPEAQVDRFMLKLIVGYPSKQDERRILDRMAFTAPDLTVDAVLTPAELQTARDVVDDVYIDDKIKDYIVEIIHATREPAAHKLPISEWIQYGASPRATLALTVGAKATAFLAGRGYVTPQDVKTIAPDVLRHRVIVTYEAEAEEKTSEDIVKAVLDHIAVP
ncbi:MAG: AAA family ATPase [Planctomycetes bacterium]|nr:AAA family ATPase [Planctomycetota bacterium]MBI3833694.1 AAA family ATPase [Planctomycetota bacterium]